MSKCINSKWSNFPIFYLVSFLIRPLIKNTKYNRGILFYRPLLTRYCSIFVLKIVEGNPVGRAPFGRGVSHSQAQLSSGLCLRVSFLVSAGLWSGHACHLPHWSRMTEPRTDKLSFLLRPGSVPPFLCSSCLFHLGGPPLFFPRQGQTSHRFLISSMDILFLKKDGFVR